MDMNSDEHYRNTLRGLTPSHAWRNATLEAMKAAQGNKARLRRRPLAYTAAAAVLALAVSGGIWWSGRMETDSDDPGVARTPEPVVTPSPTSAIPQDDARQNDAFSIVTDLSQLMGNNPTAGQLDYMPSRLPAFSNLIPTEEEQQAVLSDWARALDLTLEETRWSPGGEEDTMSREPVLEGRCTDGTQMRLSGANFITLHNAPDLEKLERAAIDHLVTNYTSPLFTAETREETITTYDFTGEPRTTHTTFIFFTEETAPEQLFRYSFDRIEATDDSLTIQLPYSNIHNGFFLRTAEDAVASFRARDYWGSDYTAYPEQAELLQVTLEYDVSQGQPYLQPVYRILFTQNYWDTIIASRMDDGVDTSAFTGVGTAYVPAVDPQYQDEIPYRRYFNDGLAHFTPEDFS